MNAIAEHSPAGPGAWRNVVAAVPGRRYLRQALVLFAVLVMSAVSVSGAERPRRVLLVHSYARDFAPFSAIAQEFRAELSRRNPHPIEFLDASLEMARFEGVEKEEPLTAFLAAIYNERKPDLVVPLGAPAARFCHRNRSRLFGETPILLVGADKRRTADLEADERMTSVYLAVDLPLLARDVATLLPDVRHVYIVCGATPLDQFWESELRREWPPVLPGVEFHWLSSLSLDQMKETVAKTPPHSVIFASVINRDGAGVPHENESALREVRARANAPVFGYSREQFDQGTVGGHLLSMQKCGSEAAIAAVRLLAGEAPSSVIVAPVKADAPVYDWRELQRWSIPESRLPPDATVLHRHPGLWEEHRTAVLVIVAILVVQTVLITLLLALHRRARESEAGLRLTAEAASVGLWDHDVGGSGEIKASPEWRALFGLPSKGALRLEDVIARLHPDDVPKVRAAIEQAARNGGGYEVEHRVVLPEGGVRWIASMGRAETAASGRVPRTRGVSRDITARRAALVERDEFRQELAHLARVTSLGELSGALAHELNQPLGSILSNAQAAQRLLEREPADLDEVREILADIVSEDVRAGDVIKRLRALLKRGETQMRSLNVNECIEEVLELMHTEMISRGVSVVRELDPQLPPVMADRVQIQQVFLNLFTNACDAMDTRPAGTRVLTVRSSRDNESVHIVVRDTGAGLQEPPEALFQPFHTTKSKGLGMGLAICRTITEAHHGRLWAESCPEDGAVFHLSLPMAASA